MPEELRALCYTPSDREREVVEEWPVLLDEIRRCGDHALARIRVNGLHGRPVPPEVAARLADVLAEGWW